MDDELPENVRIVVGKRDLESIAIKVLYTNWKGETDQRRIIPLSVKYGKTEYHPEGQWLMEVWDVDKKAYRIYAFAGIKKWINFPIGETKK